MIRHGDGEGAVLVSPGRRRAGRRLGIHEVGPGLFGGQEVAFGEGVLGEPAVGLAARDAREDHGRQPGRDRSVIRTARTSEAARTSRADGASVVDRVLVAVERASVITDGGQDASPAGPSFRGAELSYFAAAGGNEPVASLGGGLVDVGRTTPSADLDFEQDDVVDAADPFVRSVRVGELLVGFGQQRVVELVEGSTSRRNRQVQVVAHAAQGRSDRHRSRFPITYAAELFDPIRRQPGQCGHARGQGAVENLHGSDHALADLFPTLVEVDPDRLSDEILLRHPRKCAACEISSSVAGSTFKGAWRRGSDGCHDAHLPHIVPKYLSLTV